MATTVPPYGNASGWHALASRQRTRRACLRSFVDLGQCCPLFLFSQRAAVRAVFGDSVTCATGTAAAVPVIDTMPRVGGVEVRGRRDFANAPPSRSGPGAYGASPPYRRVVGTLGDWFLRLHPFFL
jgi:hypothetical protein